MGLIIIIPFMKGGLSKSREGRPAGRKGFAFQDATGWCQPCSRRLSLEPARRVTEPYISVDDALTAVECCARMSGGEIGIVALDERWRNSRMTVKHTNQEDIRELKRMIAALTNSYNAILRIELGPLQKRLANLRAQLAPKRR